MRAVLVVLFALCFSQVQASEHNQCRDALANTWLVHQTTDKPGSVHIISHCKVMSPDDLSFLPKEQVAAVVQLGHKVAKVDLTTSLYQYFFMVVNDQGLKLRVGFSDFKVAYGHHFAMMHGDFVEIPPCTKFMMHFLSPGPPIIERPSIFISLPSEKETWKEIGKESMPIHVSSSPHYVAGKMIGYRFSPRDSTSLDCK